MNLVIFPGKKKIIINNHSVNGEFNKKEKYKNKIEYM